MCVCRAFGKSCLSLEMGERSAVLQTALPFEVALRNDVWVPAWGGWCRARKTGREEGLKTGSGRDFSVPRLAAVDQTSLTEKQELRKRTQNGRYSRASLVV